jgi:hypothetical protein
MYFVGACLLTTFLLYQRHAQALADDNGIVEAILRHEVAAFKECHADVPKRSVAFVASFDHNRQGLQNSKDVIARLGDDQHLVWLNQNTRPPDAPVLRIGRPDRISDWEVDVQGLYEGPCSVVKRWRLLKQNDQWLVVK